MRGKGVPKMGLFYWFFCFAFGSQNGLQNLSVSQSRASGSMSSHSAVPLSGGRNDHSSRAPPPPIVLRRSKTLHEHNYMYYVNRLAIHMFSWAFMIQSCWPALCAKGQAGNTRTPLCTDHWLTRDCSALVRLHCSLNCTRQ